VRDANWSPDFAVSSEKVLEILQAEEELAEQPVTHFDGVIAMTPTFVSGLLAFVGPMEFAGETFTAENITDLLQYQVEQGFREEGVAEQNRKDIVGALTLLLTERLLTIPLSSWGDVSHYLLQALREKQVAAYSVESAVEETLEKAGWAGAARAGKGDAFMVVDANLASLKTDSAVQRHIAYDLSLRDGSAPKATLTVTYQHTGTFDWKTTRYQTYTRVYTPLGSRLISSSGHADEVVVEEELGLTTFGAYVVVEPGETHTLNYTYELPSSALKETENGFYDLHVIKQLGAENHPLTIRVEFGTPLKTAAPSEESSLFGDSVYEVNTFLDQDKDFVVRF
jgi:hypothetical protein